MSVLKIPKTATAVSQIPDRFPCEPWGEPRRETQWFTTGDAARALRVTREGVRHLVRQEQLACIRVSKLRLFRPDDVERLASERASAALRNVRPRMVTATRGSQQLRLRLFVQAGERSLDPSQAKTDGIIQRNKQHAR